MYEILDTTSLHLHGVCLQMHGIISPHLVPYPSCVHVYVDGNMDLPTL